MVYLDEFRDRAERVLSSAIARREDLATVGTSGRIIASVVDGATRYIIERQLPREADIESAAARVCPLLLEQDAVFHGKVMNATSGLAQARADEQQKATFIALRGAGRSFENEPPLGDGREQGTVVHPRTDAK